MNDTILGGLLLVFPLLIIAVICLFIWVKKKKSGVKSKGLLAAWISCFSVSAIFLILVLIGSSMNFASLETKFGALNEEAGFNGVSIKVNDEWNTSDYSDEMLLIYPDSTAVINLYSYDDGCTKSIEDYSAKGHVPFDLDFTEIRSWKKDGFDVKLYSAGTESNGATGVSYRYSYVLAHRADDTGFAIYFNTHDTDEDNEFRDAVIATARFNASGFDESKAHSANVKQQSSSTGSAKSNSTTSPKSSSGSSQSSNTPKASSFVSTLRSLGDFEAQTLTGVGDSVIDIPCAGKPCLMTVSHDGGSNFVVKSVDASGNSVDLLINHIGPYSGVVTDYTDYSTSRMLEINADGNWTIVFSPLHSMTKAESGASFTGCNVVYIESPSAITKVAFTHDGSSNFVVKGIGMNSSKLLVNEIGAYNGTVVWNEPKSFFIVEADGNWTVTY